MEVPNSSFIPEPEVTSEVIKLNLRDKTAVDIENTKVMFMIIKSAFMQRRKTLLNGLANAGIASKEKLKEILLELNLSENVRGESLSIEKFAEIANKLC